MGVSRDEVLRVAALARLELEDDEVDALARELADILAHVAELRTTKVEGRGSSVEPPTADPVPPGGAASPADALSGGVEGIAPDFRDGFFRVPRLGSHEDTDSGTDSDSDPGTHRHTHTHGERR